LRRSIAFPAATPCIYRCFACASPLFTAALSAPSPPQPIRSFAGHSQFANIKVHHRINSPTQLCVMHEFHFLLKNICSTRKLPKTPSAPNKTPSTLRCVACSPTHWAPRERRHILHVHTCSHISTERPPHRWFARARTRSGETSRTPDWPVSSSAPSKRPCLR